MRLPRILLAALALISALTAQIPIEVVSLATETTRNEWAHVAVPAADVPEGLGWGTVSPQGWRAVVGRRLGDHSVMVHVWCSGLVPGERNSGVLDFDKEEWELDSLGWMEDSQLVPHPSVYVQDRGRYVQLHVVPGTEPGVVIHQDSAERVVRWHRRLELHGQPTPLFWRAYLYRYRGSPLALWDYQIVMSDAEDDRLTYPVFRVRMRSDAIHVVDHAHKLGGGPMDTDANGRFMSQLLAETSLADGVRPFWTGRSIELPKAIPATVWIDQGHPMRAQLDAAMAGYEGPVVACAGRSVWDGHWLGLGGVGAIPGDGEAWAAGQGVWNRWRQLERRRGSYWDERPLGMAKSPGQTGMQPNHGVVRGSEIVATGCPLPLDGYVYRLTSHLRPVGYYERDLSPVTRQARPHWATWSGRTFVRDVFTDTLGKPIPPVGHIRPDTEGWLAQDQQHYGHLELMSYYALTGRLVARDLIGDLTEVWLSAFDEFAARAIGRTWLDMAAAYRLTGDERILDKVRSQVALLDGWQDRIAGPVKCWPRYTDPRALVNSEGDPVECGVAWQIGLMVPGLAAMHPLVPMDAIKSTLDDNVEALIRAAWFQVPGGGWRCADYWAFNNGAATDASYYGNDGNVPGYSHTTGWFNDWNRLATEWGLKVPAVAARAQRIVADVYGYPGGDWINSQWHLR